MLSKFDRLVLWGLVFVNVSVGFVNIYNGNYVVGVVDVGVAVFLIYVNQKHKETMK